MAYDIPPVFEGTVEIDEAYLGGNWRNKHKDIRARRAKRGEALTARERRFKLQKG